MSPILVTGATGNVGRALITQLVAAGLPVRALVRRDLQADLPAAVQQVRGDLDHPESMRAAFAGVDRVFLMTPPQGHRGMAAAARAAGVRQIVLLSSIATQKADPAVNPIAARHAAAEQAVRESGASWTFLRPDTFAANALEWAPAIRHDGIVRLAYPLSQRCPIHERDLAAVAMLALTDVRHQGQAYWLTGPSSLTQADQVAALADALGRPLRVEAMPREQALRDLSVRMPQSSAERLLEYQERSITKPPAVSAAFEALLGRSPLSFGTWARHHADAFI